VLGRRGLEGFRTAGDQWGQTMALELLGLLARREGAFDDAITVYEEALGVVRDLGLRDEVPFLLADLGNLHGHRGDFETAAVLHKEALDLAQDLGAGDAVALARNGLATAARRQGDYGRARDLHLQALSFYREASLAAEMARSLASLGYVEELRGDLDAAEACHQESLRLTRDLSDAAPLAVALEGLACAAAARRPPTRPPTPRLRDIPGRGAVGVVVRALAISFGEKDECRTATSSRHRARQQAPGGWNEHDQPG
jgi:tetratricopeptide (TPR) repeat protein